MVEDHKNKLNILYGKPISLKINGVAIRIGVDKHNGGPSVYLWVGNQGFHLQGDYHLPGYFDTKTRAKFYAKMLRKAFKTIKNGEDNRSLK